MANKKCKMCGQYKPLMGDYCAECQSVLAYETNTLTRRIVEEMIETEDDPDIGNVSTFDSFNALMQKQAEERKKEQEAVPTKKEAYDAIFQQIMQNNGIPVDLRPEIKEYLTSVEIAINKALQSSKEADKIFGTPATDTQA